MTLHRRAPQDLTPDRIATIEGGARVSKVQTSGTVMAVGQVESFELFPGIRLMRGRLRGQSAFQAQVSGVPGLVIETRLEGVSRSVEQTGGQRVSDLRAGEVEITGCPCSSQWHVCAPAQPRFETVSVAFSAQVIKDLGVSDAPLRQTAQSLLSFDSCHNAPAPRSLLCIARAMLEFDVKQPAAMVQLHAMALEYLSLALGPHLAPTTRISDDRVIHARRFIDENPGADITIQKVAQATRMSTTTLKSAFRVSTGEPIGKYMKRVRLHAARKMLQRGVSLQSASETLRYSTPDALGRALRNQ